MTDVEIANIYLDLVIQKCTEPRVVRETLLGVIDLRIADTIQRRKAAILAASKLCRS